jgi:hypothetical protein
MPGCAFLIPQIIENHKYYTWRIFHYKFLKNSTCMKFKGSIEIGKSKNEVTEFFADPKYLSYYQDGFISKELVRGEFEKEGAISKINYKHGNHKMVLTENIITNQLPDTFESHYHRKHMDNTMKSKFIALNSNRILYEYEFDYTRVHWFLPKLIAILFPGMYRK